MKSKSVVTVAMFSLFVAGCATEAQQQAKTIVTGLQGAFAQFKTCSASTHATPAFAVVHLKAPGGGSSPTLEQLADQLYATDSEIAAVYSLHDAMQVCRSAFLNQIATVEPSLGNIIMETYSKSDANLLLLIQKKQTWGDYNKAGQQIAENTNKAVQGELARMETALNQQNAAELAQRQQAAAMLLQYWQNQQAINAINRPSITTCNRFGTMTTCTTN